MSKREIPCSSCGDLLTVPAVAYVGSNVYYYCHTFAESRPTCYERATRAANFPLAG